METWQTIKKEKIFIIGDLSKINEEKQRTLSFEEVSNLFEGYFYTEVNISTGFNIDILSDIMYEKLYKEAKNKLQIIIDPPKEKEPFFSQYNLIVLFFLLLFILFYSIFMYIGLMFSDYTFATDKWYSQMFIYFLSAFLALIDFLFTLFIIYVYILKSDKTEEDYLRLRRCKINRFFLIIILLAQLAFGIYTL